MSFLIHNMRMITVPTLELSWGLYEYIFIDIYIHLCVHIHTHTHTGNSALHVGNA
jgi:hypothetical protein